jgi:acyl-CoA hydrolase/rubrerythrin
MNLSGSKTKRNLKAAFAAECEARSRYIFSADQAKEAGLDRIADVFYELAANEGEHAKGEFDFLGGLGEQTRENIERAARKEHLEHTRVYPAYARIAREEGFAEIADFFDKMAKVEGEHEKRLRNLLKDIDGIEPFEGKTVLHSATQMAQIILPGQTNTAGLAHGGDLMKLIDIAAGVAARRHCGKSVVTARAESLNFYQPVRLGGLVLIDSRLTFVSRSSMEVKVDLDAEPSKGGRAYRAMDAVLIMVAIDDDGRPAEVPPLLVSTEAQEKLYKEGRARYKAYKRRHTG